jgi:prepilin-type N-terminal cleavage/methylation domain-containing protein
MAAKRAAYSLAEMIVVVMILGALACIAIPQLNFAALHHKQANAIAKKIVTDLRRTRTLAISKAVNNPSGYKLQMVGSSPYTSYQIIDSNSTATVVDTLTIDSPVSCTGGSLFKFGPLGNLLSGSSSTPITVSSEGQTYTITIISATGIVECTGG